jgi:hypothetical protein
MPNTSLSVDLVIVTPDQLRKIDFTLIKDAKTDGSVEWILKFGLNERKKTTDPFIQIITLSVKVDRADNSKAEVTAKKGLDDNQIVAALAAANSAKLLKQGAISKASAADDARRVITVRKF